MPLPLGPLRAPARTLGFGALTAGALVYLHAREAMLPAAEQAAMIARHKRRYFGATLRIFGADLAVLHGPPPRAARARLIVANHRSALDVGVLMGLFDAQALSRGDLAKWPLIGLGARKFGTLFVDRDDQASRAGAVRVMRRALQAGRSIVVFAEGTTYAGDEVRPFHPGAFLAARGLDVEVLPVGLAYEKGAEFVAPTFREHLGDVARRPRTRVVASLGAPVAIPRDPRVAAESLREAVSALVLEARAALDLRR